jgi:hypothetical protein
MAAGSFFKTLTSSDKTTTRTLLHENIPITQAILHGTYTKAAGADSVSRELNVKSFSHNMFVSVYDYPHASSSANHVFDMSVGLASDSTLVTANQIHATNGAETKEKNIYSQMAQMLVGYDTDGVVRKFDVDGDFTDGSHHKEVVFFNFSRLLTKDEIKKGTFSMVFHTDQAFSDNFHSSPSTSTITIDDTGNATDYKVNSPAGEFGILKATTAGGSQTIDASVKNNVGLIFYQAGIVVLNLGIFACKDDNDGTTGTPDMGLRLIDDDSTGGNNDIAMTNSTNLSIQRLIEGSKIGVITDAVRERMKSVTFNNTTELNSTIYFCRANHNEFNYSSNPTYLENSKIRVKANEITTPSRSYITTVGLYSADNELLAVAKVSEPLRKDPSNELTLRVRLDY